MRGNSQIKWLYWWGLQQFKIYFIGACLSHCVKHDLVVVQYSKNVTTTPLLQDANVIPLYWEEQGSYWSFEVQNPRHTGPCYNRRKIMLSNFGTHNRDWNLLPTCLNSNTLILLNCSGSVAKCSALGSIGFRDEWSVVVVVREQLIQGYLMRWWKKRRA